ncbi:unnamed protein product, partial [Scytosiphon promiscuus]
SAEGRSRGRHRRTAPPGSSSRNDVHITTNEKHPRVRGSATTAFVSMTACSPTIPRPSASTTTSTTTIPAARATATGRRTARNPLLRCANDSSRGRRSSATRVRSPGAASPTSLRAVGGGDAEEEPADEVVESSGGESSSSSVDEGGGGGEDETDRGEGASGGGEEGVSEGAGAEKMELRDFRARLMSKGLDG